MRIFGISSILLMLISCSSEAEMSGGNRSVRNRYLSSDGEEADGFTPSDNNAPVAVDDLAEADQGVEVEINLLENDSDPDFDELRIFELGESDNSVFSKTEDGKISYTANADFSGVDTFTYKVSDGMTISEGQVTIKVCRYLTPTFAADQPVNYRPKLAADEIIVSLKGISGGWCAWDSNNANGRCPLSCDNVRPPISANGKYLYKSFDHPYHDNSGSCTFSVRVCTNSI